MNYINEIAEFCLALNPAKKILDGSDYTIIAEWEKQDIPLYIVLAAINEAAQNGRHCDPVIGSVVSLQDRIQKNYLDSLQARRSGASRSG